MNKKNTQNNNINQQEKNYFDYLKDKNVVLVGPASYLLGQGKGQEIDSYDVVVRMNHIFDIIEQYPEDLGRKTDVLYLNFGKTRNLKSQDFSNLKRNSVKYIVSKSNFARRIDGSFCFVSATYINNILRKKINKMPNMGLISIIHLLTSSLKTLTIMGCDFYQTGYFPGYLGIDKEKSIKATATEKVHEISSQVEYLAGIWEVESRLIVDDVLKNILNDYKKKINDEGILKNEINEIKQIINIAQKSKNNVINKNKKTKSKVFSSLLNKPKKNASCYLWRNASFK